MVTQETADLPSNLRLGWLTVPIVTAFYVLCVIVASYPLIWTFQTHIAGSLFDPLQHLWIMRWYKTCLLEGRSPVLCPELQYPAGAALGNFSPLHFEAMLYIPLSLLLSSDALCFNLIWLFGMVTTGLGTFLLAWQAIKDRWCSAFAGMLAMFAAPMLLHGRAHLELIHLGCFPLFLVAWVRFVDSPSRRRLAIASGTYILVALCAAYYVVFAAVPATLYVVMGVMAAGRREAWSWFRGRIGWLALFGAIAIVSLAMVFGNTIWAISHGFSTSRTLPEFNRFSSPLWTYFTPTTLHPLSALMPANIYEAAGYGGSVGERASYLGVVTLGLLFYAFSKKAKLQRSGFLWITLATLILLGWGGMFQVGSVRFDLPAAWLKKYVPAFSMIRVPSRFNLFVGVIAAVIAAAGLKHLLARLPRKSYKIAVFATLVVVAMADLSTLPFSSETIPPMPPAYNEILRRDPAATFLEIPQFCTGGAPLYSTAGYWQSLHRGKTNAGYSGGANAKQDDLVTWNSPFDARLMLDPYYLNDPSWSTIDVVSGVDFSDYAWVYLHANHFRYVILHLRPEWTQVPAENLQKLKKILAPAKVFEDAVTVVYDREKLAKPTHPVVLSTEGWRICWYQRQIRAVGKDAKIVVYNPDANRAVTIALNASARPFPKTRHVRVRRENAEIARLDITSERDFHTYAIGPLRLPEGLSELTLESDSDDRPKRAYQAALENDWKPYSFRVAGLVISNAGELQPPTLQSASSPRVIK